MKIKPFIVAALTLVSTPAWALSPIISAHKPVTSSTAYYHAGAETFAPAQVVDGRTGDTGAPGNWSFWLAAQGINRSAVTVDLGSTYHIDGIGVQDTHNRAYRDRGVRDFVISTSRDGRAFTRLIAGSFSQQEWAALAWKRYTPRADARYVRFEALTCWGCQSVGLNELEVRGVPAR